MFDINVKVNAEKLFNKMMQDNESSDCNQKYKEILIKYEKDIRFHIKVYMNIIIKNILKIDLD